VEGRRPRRAPPPRVLAQLALRAPVLGKPGTWGVGVGLPGPCPPPVDGDEVGVLVAGIVIPPGDGDEVGVLVVGIVTVTQNAGVRRPLVPSLNPSNLAMSQSLWDPGESGWVVTLNEQGSPCAEQSAPGVPVLPTMLPVAGVPSNTQSKMCCPGLGVSGLDGNETVTCSVTAPLGAIDDTVAVLEPPCGPWRTELHSGKRLLVPVDALAAGVATSKAPTRPTSIRSSTDMRVRLVIRARAPADPWSGPDEVWRADLLVSISTTPFQQFVFV
jgi:hypothetical protein